MSLKDDLREAQFVHCAEVEDWWAFNDRLEERGCERRTISCQRCKFSELDYSACNESNGYSPALACKRFRIRVSDNDSCKYAVDDGVMTQLMFEIQEAENRTENKRELSQNESSNSSGCYIATAIYGTYDCPEVWTLRRYRDRVLAKTWYGRLFIHLYYAFSPTVVRLFGKMQWFQNFFRNCLDPWVIDLQANGFESTPYND